MLNFTNRATYITAVAQWKADYKELSKTIRAAKLHYKATQRANDLGPMWKAHSELKDLSYKANQMLAERAAGKEQAQAQYLAEKENRLTA